MHDTPHVDFDVRISARDGAFMVEVTQSPVGNANPVALQWPFKESIDITLLRVENALMSIQLQSVTRSGPMSAEEQVLRDFGSGMFNAVFRSDPGIARRFNGSLDWVDAQRGKVAGLRVKLTIDPPELSALPWEYVFDDSFKDPLQSFLCLRARSPIVRFLPIGDMQGFGKLKLPLKILGMIANPGATPGSKWTPLDVERERTRIEQAVGKVADPSKIKFRWVKGETAEDLESALREDSWHIFHFIGHGVAEVYADSDGTQRCEPYLVLSDGLGGAVKVSPSQLALRLEDSARLRLAVLNCCEIGRHAGAVLMHGGLPSVVAMQFKITNEAAVRFASVFYGALLAGKSVEKALTAARVSMQLHCGMEWATPVLFTRTGSDILFENDGEASAKFTETAPLAMPPAPFGGPDVRPGPPPRDVPAPVSPAVLRRQQAQGELRRIFAGVSEAPGRPSA